jgi:hypothetical protein|tara:strand:+ start:381 stop:857 length:477 start_codon:yes stop_codon:yes gene_type:complete
MNVNLYAVSRNLASEFYDTMSPDDKLLEEQESAKAQSNSASTADKLIDEQESAGAPVNPAPAEFSIMSICGRVITDAVSILTYLPRMALLMLYILLSATLKMVYWGEESVENSNDKSKGHTANKTVSFKFTPTPVLKRTNSAPTEMSSLKNLDLRRKS